MAKKTKLIDPKLDLERVDAFNNFMIRKGAFVRIGEQLVQNPAYPYSYQPLYEEFKKLHG